MALARARLSPSTMRSTVVPRAIPKGATVSSVGGVVRLPVGWSPESARAMLRASASESGSALFRSRSFRMIHLVNFQMTVEEARRELLSVGREFQAESPIRQIGDGAHFGEVGGAED